ncbi:MAG: monovalent cation/H+ antiporter complex subunit F [Microthrixaceae bacterium]|nr:hypothetical protein [Microthrixaceae bacterium]MCO5318632.1 monovalent cation/H+ antiporter complex subunit F [Microthrixaceae bacterium]
MTVVAWIAGGMLVVAAVLTAIHVARSRNLPDRAIGIDMLVALVLNGLTVSLAVTKDELVVALVLIIGLLGFLGTVTISRFIERRGL